MRERGEGRKQEGGELSFSVQRVQSALCSTSQPSVLYWIPAMYSAVQTSCDTVYLEKDPQVEDPVPQDGGSHKSAPSDADLKAQVISPVLLLTTSINQTSHSPF